MVDRPNHLLDLDPAIDIIAPRYSATGRPSRDPLAMLRAMVCASSLGIQSITKLVSLFRSSPVLAACAGFDPDDIPGVGTFYDFIYPESSIIVAITSSGPPPCGFRMPGSEHK
ncbi:MAG: transposase [Bacillota bacterium]